MWLCEISFVSCGPINVALQNPTIYEKKLKTYTCVLELDQKTLHYMGVKIMLIQLYIYICIKHNQYLLYKIITIENIYKFASLHETYILIRI